MSQENKPLVFIGISGTVEVAESFLPPPEPDEIEIVEDKLNFDYSKHLEPFTSGKRSAEGSVMCYPEIKSESQVNARKEFEELKRFEDEEIVPLKTFSESQKLVNQPKNRYINVLPCN